MTFNFTFGLTVYFDKLVASQIHQYIERTTFKKESGGILVGYVEPLKNTITITDITYPQTCDRRSLFRFLRKQSGHQAIMDNLWKESNFEKMYLGEWHTHNTPIPTPSSIDIREWKKTMRKSHNSPHIVFMIIGTNETRLWTIKDNIAYSASEMIE